MASHDITSQVTGGSYDITPGNINPVPTTDFTVDTPVFSSVARATTSGEVENFNFTGGTLYQIDLNLRRPSAGQLFPR